MKKETDQREPSASSLREIPPLDFRKLKPGKKNPFAKRMQTEGWTLHHEAPSEASLKEMPELPTRSKGRANPYAERVSANGIELQVGRGRPKKGDEVGPTQVKSIRLPPEVWKKLQRQAKRDGMTLHALVRSVLLRSLQGDTGRN